METTCVSLIGGATPTEGVLYYTHVGSCRFMPPKKTYAFGSFQDEWPQSWQDSYYSVSVNEDVTRNQIEIIHNFVSTLLENAEELRPEFSEMVDKHFWDLV